jgi:hypothetical protein
MHLKLEILSTITNGTEATYWLEQIMTKDPKTRVTLTISHDDGTLKFLMTSSAKMIFDFIQSIEID